MNYRKYTLDNYTYQRTQLGTIRVQLKYENLYDCDYLMFKNTSFENKWFYAFITGVAYISNEVSEIYYELDVMQTWCYNYSFNPSFVERRHATDDTRYANTQPEGLELGPSYKLAANRGFNILPNKVCILATESLSTTGGVGWTLISSTSGINGMATGLFLGKGTIATAAVTLNAFVNAGKEDEIVAVYQASSNISGDYGTTDVNAVFLHNPYGFTPKNNKLYCAPFVKITMTNNSGIASELLPQLITWTASDGNNDTCVFTFEAIDYPSAQCRYFPKNYKNAATNQDNSISYGAFPTCAFSGDAFKVWWAQNKNSYIASLNAIQNTYDTNIAIAQNNYQIAARSASASAMMSNNSTSTALSNATMQNNTALANAQRSTNMNIASSAIGTIGNLIGLNVGGAVNSALSGVSAAVDYTNTQNTIATNQAAANASAGAAYANAGIAMSTALKNASTSQASASLSALTAKQNATAQLVAKKQDIANLPNAAKGNASAADGLNVAAGTAVMSTLQVCIEDEYAKIIDDYFTVYGYAQNCLYSASDLNKRINRPHFTYTKTVGASIKGELNSNDMIAIQEIYNNGIETWDTLENVGNYELDNTPE